MRGIIKKVTSILLSLAILSTSAINVFAESNPSDVVRTAFNFEKGSIEELFETNDTSNGIQAKIASSKELVYTYIENGIKYRVYDHANNDLTNTNSSIYKVNSNEKEILFRKEKVSVKDKIVTTTITQNGEETVSVIDFNQDDRNIISNSSNQLIQLYGTWAGYPVSNTYKHWGTFRRTKDVVGTTAASVAAVIKVICAVSDITPVTGVVVSSTAAIVAYIIKVRAPKVYYNENIAYRYTEIPNAYLQQKAAERTIRTFYTDSNRATVVDTVTTYAYSKDYKD